MWEGSQLLLHQKGWCAFFLDIKILFGAFRASKDAFMWKLLFVEWWVSANRNGQAWNLLEYWKSQVTHVGSGSFEWASTSVSPFVAKNNPEMQAMLRPLLHLQML